MILHESRNKENTNLYTIHIRLTCEQRKSMQKLGIILDASGG